MQSFRKIAQLKSHSCLILLLLGGVVSCRPRNFNNQPKTSLESVESAENLLEDDPKFPPSNNPPMNYSDDLVFLPSMINRDTRSNDRIYYGLLDQSGTVAGWLGAGEISKKTSNLTTPKAIDSGLIVAGPFSVLDYEERLRASRPKSAPVPLASASVLAILRKNRAEFSMNVEGGKANTPPLLGFAGKFPGKDIINFVIKDSTKPFSTTRCQGYDIASYSDIKWHYYCAIPGTFRACQRLTAGVLFSSEMKKVDIKTTPPAKYLELMQEAAEKEYKDVISYCTSGGQLANAEEKKLLDEVIDIYGIPLVTAAFQKLYNSQVVDVPGQGKVNMFDYLMKSSTYAFDYKRQQAVLNAYYGDMKAGVFDPSTECETFRERREQMDGPNPCDPKSPKLFAPISNGR